MRKTLTINTLLVLAVLPVGALAGGVEDWTVVESPNAGFTYNTLLAAEPLAPDDVWAAGYFQTTGVDPGRRTFMIHWNGADWTQVATPNPGAGNNQVYALEALAPNDVWAVGSSDNGDPNASSALVLHYDGAAWSTVAAPQPHRNTVLTCISALAANDIWAAGYTGVWGLDPEGIQPLAMHYDGTTWSTVNIPGFTDAQINPLSDILAIAPDDVWTVGYNGWPDPFLTLAYHFDGEVWTRVDSPNPADRANKFEAICALGPNDIWAVGSQFMTGVGYHTLTAHWDGVGWTLVPSPNRPIAGSWNFLWDVEANGPDDVWAVGMNIISTVLYPHAMHWDGSAWTYAQLPDVAFSSRVDGLALLPDGSAWAVGAADNFQGPQMSLVESRAVPVPPGDLDGDGDIDLDDLTLLLQNFAGDGVPAPGGDVDGDGDTDLDDLTLLLQNFGA
jgi:hypothetical protein